MSGKLVLALPAFMSLTVKVIMGVKTAIPVLLPGSGGDDILGHGTGNDNTT